MNIFYKTIFFTGLMFFNVISSHGQEMWPGDVNNNGIVNGLDLLFLGVAYDEIGAPRTGATTDWSGQNVTIPWIQSFPNGLNYAYADADGDGDVDDNDIENGIDANFGKTHGTVSPDVFNIGEPGVDPLLDIFTLNPIVLPSLPVIFDINLGTLFNPIQNFYGLAFTVKYDPTILNAENINFELAPLTWIDPLGLSNVKTLTKVDEANGLIHVAVTRTNQIGVDGFGAIGSFIIVVEDIIVGLTEEDRNTVVELDSMWMIDDQMNLLPIVRDSLILTIPMEEETDTMTVDTMMVDTMLVDTMTVDTMLVDTMTVDTMTIDTMTVDTMTMDTTLTDTMTSTGINHLVPDWVKVFPNPATNQVFIEAPNIEIRQIELYDYLGKRIPILHQKEQEQQILSLADIPNGLYFITIRTSKGVQTKRLIKQ